MPRFAHLSNHCIQVDHEDFGKVDATSDTNEVSFRDFQQMFDGGECVSGRKGSKLNGDGEHSFQGTILPQLKRITVEALLAAKEQMCVSETSHFTCAQLFGFDFMIDDAMKASLIEINSSPASADHLRAPMAEQIFHLAYARSVFPSP